MKHTVYVPCEAADRVRTAIGEAGGGRIGNYSHCSFSTRGIGRFKPEAGAEPALGEVETLEEVEKEKIECICASRYVDDVVAAIRAVHPYEEPALDVCSVELR